MEGRGEDEDGTGQGLNPEGPLASMSFLLREGEDGNGRGQKPDGPPKPLSLYGKNTRGQRSGAM